MADRGAAGAGAQLENPRGERPWLQRNYVWLGLWYLLGFHIPGEFPDLPKEVVFVFNILSVLVLWYKCK